MHHHTTTLPLLPLLLLSATATLAQSAPITCPLVFDGRIPTAFAANPTLFDSAATNTIYNADNVKGNNLTWSQILKFPDVTRSRFDTAEHAAVEVTISDQSIFQKQKGFRRVGLQFLEDAPDGEGQRGVKTLHWSVKQDKARALNVSHEYLNIWHEKADFSANQIQFQTGQLLTQPANCSASNASDFKILDQNNTILFQTAMDMSQWQNFAMTLDYEKNQVQIFHSTATAALSSVAGPTDVSLSGGGQFQIGMLKKPTGTSDVVNGGFQESGLDEGQIYGGVFLEDSAGGCVSL